tara:strand:+ start:429 stop:1415 length:987 start_codon:yes stop_codon:yes gene_type:complete
MEANTNDAPAFEQQMQDTVNQNNSTDTSFEDALGLPTPETTEAPMSTGQTLENTPEETIAPPGDFSKNEVAPNESNDEVRYQYWQSQAAKLQNQLNEVKEYAPMVDYLRSNPEAVQNLTPGGKPPVEAETKSQEAEEFPPPPAKPEQPRGFSRDEAISDPASDSAIYLDEVEKWRDDMMTYNQLASQYQIATMRETYNAKLEGIEKAEQERRQIAENEKQMNEVRTYVQQKYNLGEDVEDFINTMNDPNSINMDDLVGYYQYKKGIAPTPQPTNTRPPQPSAAFQQTKRAQSVPTPMGVQPASSNAPQSGSVNFMDTIINDNNKQDIL